MSGEAWIAPRGEETADADTFSPRARALAKLLQAGDIAFARLVSLTKTETEDIVTLEVAVELAQDRVYDIRPRECVSIEFARDDARPPEVLALRRSFPRVPHLNQRDAEIPRSLCLFEDPWPEVRLSWTPGRFIGLLQDWLAATARNDLHRGDQPLEPLLLGTGVRLVVPANLGEEDGPVQLSVFAVNTAEMRKPVLVARHPEDVSEEERGLAAEFVATVLVGEAQDHGLIVRTPRTLADLEAFLSAAGLDVVSELSTRLSAWRDEEGILERKIIIATVLPKRRAAGATVEATDVFAFITDQTVASLGEKLGLWEMRDGHAATLIARPPALPEGVAVDCLHPVSELSLETAALAAGQDPDRRRIVAIGQGALGSQVVTNLLRTGYGAWTLVDKDELLPHNLARHALLGRAIGFPKAQYMAAALADTVRGASVAALVCDVLAPREKGAPLASSLGDAELILDFSASTAVSRHLARRTRSSARRIAVFLSPMGSCLVMLAEDTSRAVMLDELEAQFCRLLNRTEGLQEFYRDGDDQLRYGGTCGDVSTRMAQENVGLHSAIAAGALKRLPEGALISVWQAAPDLAVNRYESEGATVRWFEGKDWRVGIDSSLVADLISMRRKGQPSETGGVLVGIVDAEERRVHIVDALPAPADSEEWPTAFIRGSDGVRRSVERIEKVTARAVHYVGEWHSHPSGASLGMSSDDRKVMQFVATHMRPDGIPGIITIVGETGVQCHIDEG